MCAFLTVGVGAAMAATYSTHVTLTLHSNGSGDTFKGRVSSPRGSCIGKRKVTVFLVEGSSPDPANDTKIRTAHTGQFGRYGVRPQGGFASPGDYYAKVARRVLTNVTCKRALSPVVTKPL
jgi:hypothetical protein